MIKIKINSKKKFVVPLKEKFIKINKVDLKYVNPLSKNLTAEITKISHEGQVYIKFNSTLDLSEGIKYFKDHI